MNFISYNKESFSDEFKGKILSEEEIKLYNYAKERTPVKIAQSEEEKIGIDYYLMASFINFKQSTYKLIETQVSMNCDLQITNIIGNSFSKPVFEYFNEEKLKCNGRVEIRSKSGENEIYKTYTHYKNSLLLKEFKSIIVQDEVFISNKFSKYVFFKYNIENVKFYLNILNGIITVKFKLSKESFDETKMFFEKEIIKRKRNKKNFNFKIKKQKKTKKIKK